jgi:hypothetical protein
MEGRKIICDSRTVERELVATTPIRAPSARVEHYQQGDPGESALQLGLAPPKSDLAVRAIIIETIKAKNG